MIYPSRPDFARRGISPLGSTPFILVFKDFSKSLTSYWEWALTPWTVRLYLGCGAGHFQGHECYGKFEPRLSLARPSLRYQRRAAGGRDRLQRSDFERLFSGGYDEHGDYDAATVFLGDTVTVANSDTLPAVFGSVRAYYDSMSLDRAAGETEGKFQLHAQLINADDGNGYPRLDPRRSCPAYCPNSRTDTAPSPRSTSKRAYAAASC